MDKVSEQQQQQKQPLFSHATALARLTISMASPIFTSLANLVPAPVTTSAQHTKVPAPLSLVAALMRGGAGALVEEALLELLLPPPPPADEDMLAASRFLAVESREVESGVYGR